MTNAGIVRRFLTEGYENKNYTAVMACLAEDYVDHSPAGAGGSAQAVDILKLVAAQLSGLTVQVLDLFSEGDRVAARIQFDGVHTGECMGIPATGKRLR
ncbi:MAG: ester cyclase [Aristaeellaceae bacterium]